MSALTRNVAGAITALAVGMVACVAFAWLCGFAADWWGTSKSHATTYALVAGEILALSLSVASLFGGFGSALYLLIERPLGRRAS